MQGLSSTSLARWRRTAVRLVRLGGDSDGNELLVFVNGDDAFSAMLAAIDSARRRVWFETYIFEPDALGRRVLAALTAAAVRGVEVRLLVDDIGSDRLSADDTAALAAAGGRVVRFNEARRLFRRRLPLHMRDHRKVVVVDDEHGFVGGMNVSEDYAGPALGNGRFRDTHMLVSGPATAELGAVFARSWESSTGELLPDLVPAAARIDGSHVQILGSDMLRRRRRIQRALHVAVTRARRAVFLTTPYFIPPPRLVKALRRAARRGVDVRVLTAGVSDVPIAAAAARHLYGTLLESGVRVCELQGLALHAKTAVVNGFYAHVGSFNLDRWSYDRNLEVVAMTLDPGVGQALERVFADDVARSVQVDLPTWHTRDVLARVWGAIAWQLCRL